MARTGAVHDNADHVTEEHGLDEDLITMGAGVSNKFPHIWDVAERYVRRGDGLYGAAGLALIREFTFRMPLMQATELIEWYFERSAYTPRTGNGPDLATEAFRAAVAVGLTDDYLGDESTDSERRQRMMAVVAQSLGVAPSVRDRSLIERAFRALDQRIAEWWNSPSSRHDAMLGGRAMDAELVERCIEAFDDGRNGEAIRSAMIVLESRLRTSANLPATEYGSRLVHKAMGSNSRLNFGQSAGDRRGLTEFFTSVLSFFRNPNAHQFIEHDAGRTIEVLSVVDLALDLLSEANTRLYEPAQYLAPNEEGDGLRVDRVLHTDLDGDGADERVLVCSSGSLDLRRLKYLLLKQVDGRWVRLPITPIQPDYGYSDDQRLLAMYEADLANDGTKQIVIVAASSASGDAATMHILRWRDHEAGWVGCASPEGGSAQTEVVFAIVAGLPEFRDVDGDGTPELYVRHVRVLDPYVTPVSVSYLDVFDFDAERSCLTLRYQQALGDMPASAVAYEFVQTLKGQGSVSVSAKTNEAEAPIV